MFAKVKHKFPVFFIICLIIAILLYHFSYCFPFTNNAFVVANSRPVAANVSGYITNLYVKNEEYVKKGQPLFTVFERPYQLAYEKAVSDYEGAKARLISMQWQVEKTQHLLKSQQDRYEKIQFDYQRYHKALQDHAVSEVKVNNLLRDMNENLKKMKYYEMTLKKEKQDILVQHMKIASLKAIMENAKVDLKETTVYAKNNGIVQNMFVALGTPIEIRKPVFSFINTDQLYIQANFNETDLRHVQPGNKVSIYARMYFGSKTYHGRIVSKNWAVNRQYTDNRSQEQIVTNSESNWFLLPQRFPVQIQITDYDPEHFPLALGSSAYVYVHTS
jgi:multidrug resistance efflux pump